MLKAYKTELNLTPDQLQKLKQDTGNVRKIYNIYVAFNKTRQELGESLMFGYDFSKYFNNNLVEEYPYIKLTSSKAIKQSIMNCDRAWKTFFKKFKEGQGAPKFKKYFNSVGVYLPRDNSKDIQVERHRLKVPTYKWLRLKEKGYIPTKGVVYNSITLTLSKDGRAFASVLVDQPDVKKEFKDKTEGVGIDLGVKVFASISNGVEYGNINKTPKVVGLKKKLKKLNRKLSKKVYRSNNYRKLLITKNKVERRLNDIRKDYYRKVAIALVKAKPEFIALEDLCIKSMLKNKGLAGKIREMNFYNFRVFLENKAKEYGVEVRYVDRWFPSSKTCNKCGVVKGKLPLSERIFKCECGYEVDRDLNAAYNIRDAATPKV